MKMTSQRHARYLSIDLKDDATLVFRKPSWQLRACLASVLITPILYQLYFIIVTIRYILFLQNFSSPPRPACPVVDLSWTGVFPCELGWRGSALAVLILSAVLITCYSLITACLVRWNPRKQWNSTTSIFDTQKKPTKFQVRVQSTNRLMLPPTLSLCILLLIFRLLLQSGDVEANPGPTFSTILTINDLPSVYEKLIKAAKKWFNLGLKLKVSPDTLDNISDEHRDNETCLRKMLAARLNTATLTYSEICQSLRAPTVRRDAIAKAIEEECTDDGTSPGPSKRQKLSTTTPGPTKSKSDNRSTIQPDEAIGIYRSYLTSIYDTRFLPADDKYPLQCVKHFVNLECADVSKHLSRKKIEESWSEIVKGKLNRFPRKSITLDQIASKVEGKFSKLVVIKGAPGGGKTTLSWELCRRWANGEVWTDYSLVVLLRLRDENVQKAVELVDLFQCEDTDYSQNIYAIIRKNHGEGILFILEGLDELTPSLRENDSIFMKLITGLLLPASTVLVTTRPWAVCDLPVTCSSRVDQFIEILGFSSEQIHEYIDLMIKDGAPPGLRQYIDSNPRISSAMYNPLHARIVVEVYRENYENSDSIIPNTTTELYTEYSQILIKRCLESDWSGELSELPSSLQVHFDKLCQIAYNGITKEKQQLVFFKEDVVDTNTLGFMNSVHPLYNKRNSSPSYNFLHLTLQEFLAAFYVWKNKTPHEQLILFEDDRSYKMILLFLAGLTKLNDPWTQCVLPTPYVYYKKGSSKAERLCRFSSDQILWIYESQNVQAMKDLYCNVLYEQPLYDPRIDQFALGYVVASAHFKVTEMNMFKFNENKTIGPFNYGVLDRSMILAGINKVLPSFTLSVKRLKMSTTFKIPSAWHTLIDRILPELESVSISNLRSRDIGVDWPDVPCALKIFDTIQLSPNLSVVELDFGISRDTVIRILDILKPKHYLKVLKCAQVSPADEELLSDFIAHSSIEMLVIHLAQAPYVIESPITDTNNWCISIGLNVTELKRNSTKILPHLLSEYSITNNKAKKTFLTDNVVFSESTIRNLISILSHWKLSLQYLRCSSNVKLTPGQSQQLFSTLLNCQILKELDIESEIKGKFEYFCIPQHLQSLTLFCPDNACDVLRSLKDNRIHSIKSFQLTCNFNWNFDEAIGEYLQTDTSLEELTLKYNIIDLKSSLSHLVQGLQVNTCLTKLTISPHIIIERYSYDDPRLLELAQMFQLNTTLQFIELAVDMQLPMLDLLPVLEALRENNTVKHLILHLYVLQFTDHESFPRGTPYTVTTEEAEAVGNVLAKNKTLEVFHFIAKITECSPIVRGLLENKTLKEFGISGWKTKKNIVTCPEYVDVRRRIVFMERVLPYLP
ncbi:uncharacterized protein LOC135347244 isoform X2 [Halichondria panicea]|uniref:uncharacterized protein LOC135347244 isoform X2 n=1 Tax=Halichondria panicea TaxID=6063 RepID=UPI00312BA7CD